METFLLDPATLQAAEPFVPVPRSPLPEQAPSGRSGGY
jgi:hypothetical protein